jgi:hypothetical protein
MSGRFRGAAALALAWGLSSAAPALAQSLSDESVRRLMEYAWAQTPQRFTTPDSRTIDIDKTKPDKVLVPVEIAREVIIAARRSALAQICNLEEMQVNNYRSLMARELSRKKWSDPQIVYINVLHLTVVQIFAGDVTITVQESGDKKIVNTEPQNKKKQTCSDAEGAKVREQIEAYIAEGPKLLEPPVAAASPPPAPAAPAAGQPQPASAPAKK